SMGGFASAWFTLRRPQAVGACVFIAPALRFLQRQWERLSDAERRAWHETGRRRVVNQYIDVEVGFGLAEERDLFPPEQLNGWATPALLCHGRLDDVVPLVDSETFAERAAPGAVRLHVYDEGDHRLEKHADDMAGRACDFLASHASNHPDP